MKNKNKKTIVDGKSTTVNTDFFSIEVKEDNDRLGIIVDIFFKDSYHLDTITFWNEDFFDEDKLEAWEEFKQLRKDDEDFKNQWDKTIEDFIEWYEDVYLQSKN